jgi:uncharacterized pyridoxamine 5'-phosphate oxidase family protein
MRAPTVTNDGVELSSMDSEFEAVDINGTVEFRVKRGR